jgi:uncharacterized protein with PIN domain
MLGGLARWLRAAGYDAHFDYAIEDGDLVALAEKEHAVLLSSDAPLFDRTKIKSGSVRALFVPRHRPVLEQAAFVLRELALPVKDARCMRCGGLLAKVEKREVEAELLPKTRAAYEEFWRCGRCGKVYWHGAHWEKIEARRAELRGSLE